MANLELLTTIEMSRADRLTIDVGMPGIDLMERAGAAVADVAADLAGAGAKIAVLCGPGNNGGDGFIAARVLRDRGFSVSLYLLGHIDALKGDAAEAARRWGAKIEAARDVSFDDADVVIDALFGAGLARNLDGEAKLLVESANEWTRETSKPIVAVDVPSGVDGDTGEIRGVAIEARATVTFFRFKPGHLLLPGRSLCGEQHLADIGIPDSVLTDIAPKTFANIPELWRAELPVPSTTGHKYSRGHALVVSGPAWSTGAARLSARGALRAGAGLVTLASPTSAHAVNAAQLTAIMIRPCDGPDDLRRLLSDPRFSATVMGPGLGVGEATADLVTAALDAGEPGRGIVLDADALTSFAGRASSLAARIASSGARAVLTPHEGEFARMFTQNGSKLARARAAAHAVGATVLLKGPDTVVAHPDGRASIGFDLPPWLATAGSGDVLAGIIGGLLAQGMPAFEAASAAVWMHGAAARAFGPGLIAEDIPEQLPGVWRNLLS
jgi:hydroxyethylthiazole kinase-like uncharacterized protein yjeF